MPVESQLDWCMPEEQLLLPLQARQDVTLADLPAQAFAPVLSALQQLRSGALSQVYVWGEPGSGRSLLLSAFFSAASSEFAHSVFLPLRQVVFMPPEMLEGLEHCDLVVLDDVDALADWPEWQEALFNLYNRLRERGGRLLVTAATPPAGLPLTLPDLCSRLALSSVYALPAPDDVVREELLRNTAQRRAWPQDLDVTRYVLERGPRRLGRFMQLIERLDQRALAERRALTVPLVRSVLSELGD